MERFHVNQRLLDLYDQPSYLEIGVCEGYTFHAVTAARKVAVDPAFEFDVAAARADPRNANCAYHGVPSDAYFASVDAGERFDVIFVDGLHTFDQTLRDLLNAIACLQPNGVIVIDDVTPSSYSASLPSLSQAIAVRQAIGDPSPFWMGDVYRLMFFIRDYLPEFSYATVAENHGQAVVWRARRPLATRPLDVAAIAALEYKEVLLQRDVFVVRPFAEIEAAVRTAHGAPPTGAVAPLAAAIR